MGGSVAFSKGCGHHIPVQRKYGVSFEYDSANFTFHG